MRRPRSLVARALGADLDAVGEGLRTFAGAGRRMQLIADTPRVTIYDDYGHHPTEVRAALDAVRQRVGPDRRLWAVFEPHMYSRTALLLDEFSTAFTDANEVVIADIFASRDTPEAMAATSRRGPRRCHRARRPASRPWPPATTSTTTEYVAEHLGDGDAVLVMGAGKSYRSRVAWRSAAGRNALVIGVRAAVLGALLAIGVTVAYQAVVSLVDASGARDQPALILILLLSAFLGVLTAVATRTLRLPGATAPTVLVLGWILIPVILGGVPERGDRPVRRRRQPLVRPGAGTGHRGRGRSGHPRSPGRAAVTDRRLIDEQIAYYRARAAEYDATSLPPGDPFADHADANRAGVTALKLRGRVIELAAGTGQWTGLLAATADELLVTDASPEMLRLNRAKVGQRPLLRYEVRDAFALDASHAYDVAFMGFFLSHVPRAGSTRSGGSWRACCVPADGSSSSMRRATACGARSGRTRPRASCGAS